MGENVNGEQKSDQCDRTEEQWREVKRRKPRLTKAQRQPTAFGVQVLIWPPIEEPGCNELRVAFYGCRQTAEPNFYMYGRVLHGITHWMPLPVGPKL